MDEITDPPISLRATILLVQDDNRSRPSLTKNLRQLGYRLLVAAEVEDAFEWVSGGTHIPTNLLLLDLVGKLPEESMSIGRRLRSHGQYCNQIPVVVMPDRVAEASEGTDENVGGNDWICHYEDSDQLQRLIQRLTQPEPLGSQAT